MRPEWAGGYKVKGSDHVGLELQQRKLQTLCTAAFGPGALGSGAVSSLIHSFTWGISIELLLCAQQVLKIQQGTE